MYDCHSLSVKGPDSAENDDYAVIDPSAGVFVVADGMGGRPGGSRASSVATGIFVDAVKGLSEAERLNSVALTAAISSANKGVRAIPDEDPMLAGLGTTLSAAVMCGSKGKVVHVGDSRVYLFRRDGLQQLTRDHTLTAELVERRHLSPEGAKRHPLRHLLSRSLGAADELDPEIQDLELEPGDWLILATDGLIKSLDTKDLTVILRQSANQNAEGMCRAIMDAAMQRDPIDDVTTVTARFVEDTV